MFRLFTSTARRARISRPTTRFRLGLEHLETRDTPSTTVPTAPPDNTEPVAAWNVFGYSDQADGDQADALVAQADEGDPWNVFGYGDYGTGSGNSIIGISLGWEEEGGLYFIVGSVWGDEDFEGLSVSIGGSFPGIGGSATVGSDGDFSTCFGASPGQFGTATASVTDSHGHSASAEITISI